MTFINILQVGAKQWKRSYQQKSAKNRTGSNYYTGSSVYNNYMWQSFLLIPFGVLGPIIYTV